MKKKKRMLKKDFMLLLSFLTDSNERTRSLAKQEIKDALRRDPGFRKLIPTLKDPVIKQAAEFFLSELHYEYIEKEFKELFKEGRNLDLEYGLYLLAKMEYPDLKKSQISKPLDELAIEVSKRISKQNPLPTRAISALKQVLFDDKGFEGDENNYYDPDNIYLNRVLVRKKGIPISLSCIYLLVSWRLKLLVKGVGLPGHFIVGHRVPRGVVYIDPFRKGKILRIKDCEMLVRRLGVPFRQSYLDPNTNIQILSRMVVNLINIYTDRGDTHRAQWMARLFQLSSET